MNYPPYLPVLVPVLGIFVPFIIRWIDNRSRLKKAQHLLQVIKTREELESLIKNPDALSVRLQENEEQMISYYCQELEKEISGKDAIEFRLYPILISLEIIFFASAAFTGMLGIFKSLIYAQGNETLPFLEGIFSNPATRIGLLMACLIGSLYFSHGFGQKIRIRQGNNLKTELMIFGIFNGIFLLTILLLGGLLFLLDLIIPWF
jgi:hypothetical protein